MAKQKEAQVEETQVAEPQVVAEAPKPRGIAWRLADDVDITKYRGQLAEVLVAIQKVNGGTVNDIVEVVEFANPTRQTKKRIVAYYVSLLKNEGK